MMQLKPGHEGKDRSAGSLLRKRSVVTQGDGGKGGVPLKSDTPGSTYYTTKQEKESCFKRCKYRGAWVAQRVKHPTSARVVISGLRVRAPRQTLC